MIESLNRSLRRGSALQRNLYVGVRQVIDLPATVQRRLVARKMAKQAPFEISHSVGFKVFPPGQFLEIEDVVAAAQVPVARPDLAERARGSKPTFMIPTLERSQLTLDSPYLRFALRPDVIAIITAYLGVVPVLRRVDVVYSGPSNRKPKGSQLYHQDAGATSQVKIFVLCNEVTVANGPLTVMGAETSSVLRKKISYKYDRRVTDEEVLDAVGERDQHPMTGPAGTACFVDTSRCFHYGSRVKEDAAPRTVALFQYVPPFSFLTSGDPDKDTPLRHLITPDMPTVTRLVLGGQ
jgi:hypothetical protein